MVTQGALSRARLLPTFLGALLLVLGLVKFTAGLKLLSLGGSFYYLLSGAGFMVCGVLLMLALRFAIWLFTLCLSVYTVWALWEVGLDRQQLMPRLFIWFLVGLVLLLPAVRRGLKPLGQSFSIGHLLVALLLAGISLDPVGQLRQHSADGGRWVHALMPGLGNASLAQYDMPGALEQLPEG